MLEGSYLRNGMRFIGSVLRLIFFFARAESCHVNIISHVDNNSFSKKKKKQTVSNMEAATIIE